MDVVVNRRAADVDAVLARHLRHKFFLLTGQGVENLHGISPSYGVPEAAGPLSALLFPAAHHAHAQRIGAGVHCNGAADLQQAHLTLCTGVLGTQGARVCITGACPRRVIAIATVMR